MGFVSMNNILKINQTYFFPVQTSFLATHFQFHFQWQQHHFVCNTIFFKLKKKTIKVNVKRMLKINKMSKYSRISKVLRSHSIFNKYQNETVGSVAEIWNTVESNFGEAMGETASCWKVSIWVALKMLKINVGI